MFRRIALAALLAVMSAGASWAQEAADVAGRPALTTKSAADLIKEREQWGSKPALSSSQAVQGPTVGGRPILSTKSTAELIKEREQWGKGPESRTAKFTSRVKAAGRKLKHRAKVGYRATKRALKRSYKKVRGKTN